ncbi:MAG: Stk1 family PASTA domain-containing Ser/Thr kinase, partial [Gaiellales bacterium]
MADVYLAEDEDLGRRVAIKILNDRYANDELFVERFRREAESAAGLSHPNIVSVYDRGEAEGTYYIAMEVVEGTSLKEMIITRGRLPPKQAIDFARQILGALRFAHRNGIIHRDIKPHNILIGNESRLKVTDFGIARAGATSQMTEAGSIMGTAQYLSPEQARGGQVTSASDLYSVGIVLYEMLTGKVPFRGDSTVEIAMKHVNETPAPPSTQVPRVTPELDAVVLRAMAKNPVDRYQSAEDLDADLVRAAQGLPVARETTEAATAVLAGAASATRVLDAPPSPQRATRPVRPPVVNDPYRDSPRKHRRALPWLLVLVLLGIAAAAGYYIYTQIQDEVTAPTTVTVPLVTGLTTENAVAQLEAAGLQVTVVEEPSNDVEPGRVISQRPEEGTPIEPGQEVTIVVSSGIELVAVPRVVGLPEEDARFDLENAGLDVKVRDGFSRRAPGLVFRQTPTAGEEVASGSEVEIRISRGPRTDAVPDVTGLPVEEAELVLGEAGFKVAVETRESDEPTGTVLEQDPAPDAGLERGGTVTIFVSLGPPEPETAAVPGVVGSSQDSAVGALVDSGFQVTVDESVETDPAVLGTVIAQSPAGGEEAEVGTVVVITVAVAPPPPETATVPDVLTLDQASAEAALTSTGFSVNIAQAEVADPAAVGLV